MISDKYCIWFKIDGIYKTSCGHLYHKGEEYIYCPFCGKKITVG